MLDWQKRGLVFDVKKHTVGDWMVNSALTPTPYRISDDIIRIYAGFRDEAGVSRIGFVDVLADSPETVVAVSRKPALDIGRSGCFDDNGVILGDVISSAGKLYMFYVGFQLVAKAKFLAFTGLATSSDGGVTFDRESEAPILGRAPGQTTIGAIHSVMRENGRWKIWFASGDDWEMIEGRPYPQYHIRYMESDDLLNLPRSGSVCLRVSGNEYRIGRPRVYRMDGKYVMYFTRGNITGEYFPGMAYSENGTDWTRNDADFGLSVSSYGWDSEVLCYPALIQNRDKILMFYNGNRMGVDGFGLAEAHGSLEKIT
jgi:hypothetical protein